MTTSIAWKLYIRVIGGSFLGLLMTTLLTYRVLDVRVRQSIQNNLSLRLDSIDLELIKSQQLVDTTVVNIISLKESGVKDKKVFDSLIFNQFKETIKESDSLLSYGFLKTEDPEGGKKAFSSYYLISNDLTKSRVVDGLKMPAPNDNIIKFDLTKEDYEKQPLYIIPKTTRTYLWLPTFYWRGLQSTTYVSPIIDNEENFLGVCGVTISLEPIKEILKAKVTYISNAGFYVLLDKNGTVLYHPNFTNLETEYINYKKIPELRAIDESVLFGSQFRGQLVSGNNYIVYDRVGGPGWIVVGIVPEKVVTIPLLITAISGLVVSFVLLSMTVFLYSLNLNRRLKVIIDQCLELLKEDLIRRQLNKNSSPGNLFCDVDFLNTIEDKTIEDIYLEYAIDNSKDSNDKDELDYLTFSMNVMSYRLKESIDDLEEKVAERTMKLEIEKNKANFASQVKSEFLANVSHELRTPLNSIIGYTEILLRSRKIIESEKPKLQIVNSCSYQLLELINDILDITKIESRKLELNKVLFATSDLIDSLLDICYSSCSHKGLDFNYASLGKIPKGIVSDEKRLRQVLINLLGNAIKFTKKGSVSFTVVGEEIKEGLNKYKLTFRVEDTGVGIPTEQIEKIFDPFERSTTTKNDFEGTGLGLSISKRILKELNSKINVRSELGKGSNFWFTLIVEGVTEGVLTRKTLKENAIVGFKGDSKKILVVDDRWENRSLLVNILEPLNFILIEADNGVDALKKLEANDLPDLIISDISMPEMDGFGLLGALKDNESFKNIPVIISSASVFETDRSNSLDAGAADFISKPIDYNKLLQSIKQILNVSWDYEAQPE